MRKALLLLFLPAAFLFGQTQNYPPAGYVRFVTVDPSGACSNVNYITLNTTTGVEKGCVAGTWQSIGGGGGGGAAGNTGDIQLNTGAGAFGASIANQSGSTITIQQVTLGSESLANNVTLSSGWLVDGDFTFTTGASAHATYAYSTGVIGDFYQLQASQAIPTTGNATYQMQYNVTAMSNPGGGMACQAYITSNPSGFVLPISLGVHTVYMTSAGTPTITDFQCRGTTPGQTVTIAGTAPGQPVLSWKLVTYGGDLNVSGNTNTLGNLNTIRSVSECGVVGNGHTDDTVALNACIAATPDYSTLLIPQTFKILVTDTINWHGKTGVNLMGVGTPYNGPGFASVTGAIIWGGAHNGTVLDIQDTNGGTFADFGMLSDTQYQVADAGAGVLINVDQTLFSINTTTSLTFSHLSLTGVDQNPLFQGIQFSLVAQANVEHMLVEKTTINCSYTLGIGKGIHVNSSFNALGYLFQWNTITNCARGIALDTGGGQIINNQFNLNLVHIEAYPVQPMSIIGNDTEHCAQGQIAHEGAWLLGSGPMTIMNNRIAACDPGGGNAIIRLFNGVFLIQENQMDPGAVSPAVSNNGAGTAVSIGNSYPTTSAAVNIAGFATFQGFTSTNDNYGDGTNEIIATGRAVLPNFIDGAVKLFYDFNVHKWRTMERDFGSDNNIPTTISPFLVDTQAHGTPFCGAVGTGAAYIGAFLLNPAKDTTPFSYCGKVGGSYAWTSPLVPITLSRNLPANVDDTVDLGDWIWSLDWAINFEVYIRAFDSGPVGVTAKQYKFSMVYGENGGNWYKIAALNSTLSNPADLNFDLEVADIGGGHFRLRLRNTGGVAGFIAATITTFGATDFTASTTVNTGVAAPIGTLSDAIISQLGGKATMYGDILLQSGIHLTNAAATSDTAGLLTINNGSTTAAHTFTTPFAAAPVCNLTATSDQLATIANYWVTTSTTTVTANVHTTPASSVVFAYHCIGNPN